MDSERTRLFTTFLITQKAIPYHDHKPGQNEPENDRSHKPLPTRIVRVENEFHDAQEEFILTNFLRHGIDKSQMITSDEENLQTNDTMFDTKHGSLQAAHVSDSLSSDHER